MFEVSDNKMLTPRDIHRNNSVRFAKHDTLGRKPVSQYIGPGLGILSFKIELKAQHGANPRAEMIRLEQLQSSGAALWIIFGNWVLGSSRWRIDFLGMALDTIDNRGNCISSTVDISFEEYV